MTPGEEILTFHGGIQLEGVLLGSVGQEADGYLLVQIVRDGVYGEIVVRHQSKVQRKNLDP